MEMVNGKEIAEKVLAQIKTDLELKKTKPVLTIVLVGDNEGSTVYVERKKMAAEKVGIIVNVIKLSEIVTVEEVKKAIIDSIEISDGIILQLPLPENIKDLTNEIIALIPVEKDVDCLRFETLISSSENKLKWLPPIVEAVDEVINQQKIDLTNKSICLVGKGRVTGLPLFEIYKSRGYNVVAVDENTNDIDEIIKNSDVVISATGQAHIMTSEKIKDGVLVIDAGFARKDGKIVGDVDNITFADRDVIICPSPGGVGPITVATLLLNVVKASNK